MTLSTPTALLFVIAASTVATAPIPALAQSGPPAPAGLSITGGPGIVAGPRYPGSDGWRVLPIPAFDIRYRDLVFASPQNGIGLNVIRTGVVTAGPIARPDFGRRRSDVRRYLPGLGRVGFAPELGGFVNLALSRALSLRAEARQAVGGHRGFVADLSASYVKLLPKGIAFIAGPRVSITDARYQRAYFGVTPAQSLAGGLRAYRPDGGFGSAGVGAVVVAPLLPRVTLAAFVGYARLVGDPARSPVARGRFGSRDQTTLGATLSYRFTRQ